MQGLINDPPVCHVLQLPTNQLPEREENITSWHRQWTEWHSAKAIPLLKAH